jgi:hypothetical protein
VTANKLVARQWIDEVWVRGNISLVDEMHAKDYRHHTRIIDIQSKNDTDYIKRLAVLIRLTIQELHFQVDDMLAEDGRVMIRWSIRGRDSSGNIKAFAGISLLTIDNFKIKDSWFFSDCKG